MCISYCSDSFNYDDAGFTKNTNSKSVGAYGTMKTNRVNGRTAGARSRVYAGEEAGGERCGFEKK